MENKSNIIVILGYLYIIIPNLIFFITWCNIPTAIIATLAILISFYFLVKNAPQIWVPNTKKEWYLIGAVLLISVIWVLLSGVGGYMFQNGDHSARNTLLELLTKKSWPVVYNEYQAMMSYYVGFFLPSALVAKMFKSLDIGFFFQFCWAILGVFTFFYLLLAHFKQKNIFPVILFIFFSGLDILGMYITHGANFSYTPQTHLEWWIYHQYSSMTTQLFWVFNQAIPAWVIVSLFLHEKNNKSLVFLYVCLFINSTLPAMGLLPFLIYFMIKNGSSTIKEVFTFNHIKKVFTDALSIQNLLGVFILFPVLYLYLTANFLSSNVHTGDYVYYTYMKKKIDHLIILRFWIIEVGIFLFCILRYNFKNIIYWMVFILFCLFPYLRISDSPDFEMRASIPALVFLYLLVVETIQNKEFLKNKVLSTILFVALLIGAVTPFNEIGRCLINTKYNGSPNRLEFTDLDKVYKHVTFYSSFRNNKFYKYFAKKK